MNPKSDRDQFKTLIDIDSIFHYNQPTRNGKTLIVNSKNIDFIYRFIDFTVIQIFII